jgi:hypothetical protein
LSQIQSFMNSLKVTIVSFALVFSTLPLAQASETAKDKLDSLRQEQAWMKGVGAETRMLASGPQVMDRVQQFINDPKNKEILKTDAGVYLLNEHTRMSNFFMVKSSMEDCKQEGEDPNNRQLRGRITEAARVSENCVKTRKDLDSFASITDLNANVQAITNKIFDDRDVVNKESKGGPSDLQDLLFAQSLKNSASTLMDIKYRYDKDFLKVTSDKQADKQRDNKQLAQLALKLCPTDGITCTQNQIKSVWKHLREEAKILKRDKQKVTYEQARSTLNEKIERLNVKLKAVPFDTDEGYIKTRIWDSSDANLEKEETTKAFGEYVAGYLQEASSSDGNLLLTDSLKKDIGGLRLLEDGDLEEKTGKQTKFTFKNHKLIEDADQIKESVDEVKEKINDQISQLKKMSSGKSKQYDALKGKDFQSWGLGADKGEWKKSRLEHIKKLVKTNPAAVGQILLENPEYAKIVCEMIQIIEEDDKDDASSDKAWMWGGIIVGGALALTGIGAGVGAALIAGSVATATLTTIATGAFVAGVVVGGGEATYWGKRAYEHDREIREVEQAYFAGNSDTHSIITARESLTKFKDARFDAALALGFALADVGALKVLGAVGKGAAKTTSGLARASAKTLSPKQVDNLTKIYRKALEAGSKSRVLKTIKLLGKNGAEKMDRFFTFLAQASDATRIKILEKISSGAWTPNKLKKIVDESLAAANKACLK